MALTSISDDNTPDLGLKSLTVLHNGGILLELLSKEAVQWVSDKSHLKSLAIASGGDLSIKTQTFNIVVPFFPISTAIEELDGQCVIEDDNKLPEGSIIAARWIKPPCRRENKQCVAHMMFHMLSLEAANFLIQEGLYHDMEHLRPVKDKKEPMCCLKCQQWGHMAKDCREHKDTCSTCAGNHRTNACTAYKTFHCVNCNLVEHGSWGHKCLEFVRQCCDLDMNTPDNMMPFFPTNEPWTQVHLSPKPTGSIIPTRAPTCPRAPAANRHGRQTILEEHVHHRTPNRNRALSHAPTPSPSQCSEHSNSSTPKGSHPDQCRGNNGRSPSLPPTTCKPLMPEHQKQTETSLAPSPIPTPP